MSFILVTSVPIFLKAIFIPNIIKSTLREVWKIVITTVLPEIIMFHISVDAVVDVSPDYIITVGQVPNTEYRLFRILKQDRQLQLTVK